MEIPDAHTNAMQWRMEEEDMSGKWKHDYVVGLSQTKSYTNGFILYILSFYLQKRKLGFNDFPRLPLKMRNGSFK